MEKERPKFGKRCQGNTTKHLRTVIYEEIVAAAKGRDRLSGGTEDQLADRETVRQSTIRAERWAKIFKIMGWAGLAFCDWVPKSWINREGEKAFASILEGFKSKYCWMKERASEIFEKKFVELLFSSGSRIIQKFTLANAHSLRSRR